MKRLIVSIAVMLSLVALVNAEPNGAFLTPKPGAIEGESRDEGHTGEIEIPGIGNISTGRKEPPSSCGKRRMSASAKSSS